MNETPEEIAYNIYRDAPRIGNPSIRNLRPDDAAIRVAIAAAIRDAYERAAKRAWLGGDPDSVVADLLRMRDGEQPKDDGAAFWAESPPDEQRMKELY